jgi:hypothetical protein
LQREKKRKSQKQEKRVAREARGLVSSGSGNGLFVKADITSKEFKIEAKRTDNADSISLKKSWLNKVARQAFSEHKVPVLAIEFGDSPEQFFVLRESEFKDYVAYLRQ